MEAFRYEGKRALVVGGATGMGAAAGKTVAALGAEVVAADVAPIDYDVGQALQVDLRDKGQVDEMLDAIEGRVDVLFSCAGVADGTPGLMLINYISHRHIIDRLIERGSLVGGGAVVMIASVAGLGWLQSLPTLVDLLDARTWEEAAEWVEQHEGTDNYLFSKMAINAYVARSGLAMLKQGVRINAVLPGPTDTPLARANADLWLTFGEDYRKEAGVDTLTPQDIADTMAFLGSDAARAVNGVTLLVDQGHVSAAITDAHPDALVKALMGLE